MGDASRRRREGHEARAAEAAADTKPKLLVEFTPGERIVLRQLFDIVPNAKEPAETVRRRNVKRALMIDDAHVWHDRGRNVLALGRYVQDGEKFQPVKKTGRRLYELTEDRAGYLLGWIKAVYERQDGMPTVIEETVAGVYERLTAVKEGKYTPPVGCKLAGEDEVYAETPEQEGADDEDDTESAE